MGYMLKTFVQLWPLLKEVFVKDNSKDAQSKKLVLLVVTIGSILLFVNDSRSMAAWFGKSILDANDKATEETMCSDQRLIGYLEEHIQELLRNQTTLVTDRDALQDDFDALQQQLDALQRENRRLERALSDSDSDTSTAPESTDDAWNKYQELYNDS